ncbi:hypothetical protein BO83DRAFT_237071 [Aspergillus eucalypticola CBS 122712]|uniref:Uncharacterized protein n=1 Tax=Aspergillus eucalypticola (strain CBS 122712 / IBT 29274) TaxID=1448314 RepID=A0A317VQW8_ASPEC|nr:uncharacterized protein BO83DRAFT_237071 [Aspergillus eucalypticola CBS 122712]PWY76703.1 hypothetical protein BO83DRAFT_237071 [Aspergillus eucalypticola CBS 122712]
MGCNSSCISDYERFPSIAASCALRRVQSESNPSLAVSLLIPQFQLLLFQSKSRPSRTLAGRLTQTTGLTDTIPCELIDWFCTFNPPSLSGEKSDKEKKNKGKKKGKKQPKPEGIFSERVKRETPKSTREKEKRLQNAPPGQPSAYFFATIY